MTIKNRVCVYCKDKATAFLNNEAMCNSCYQETKYIERNRRQRAKNIEKYKRRKARKKKDEK